MSPIVFCSRSWSVQNDDHPTALDVRQLQTRTCKRENMLQTRRFLTGRYIGIAYSAVVKEQHNSFTCEHNSDTILPT
jgi:hypothetical protein